MSFCATRGSFGNNDLSGCIDLLHDDRIGSTAWLRSSAWICDFSSTHSTKACSGGAMYSPTTSRTLVTKSGSIDSLKVSCRCGFRPKARQIRCTVLTERPLSRAMPRELQCVASSGWLSNVRVMTASMQRWCMNTVWIASPPQLRVLFDTDGDRHAEAGQLVEGVAGGFGFWFLFGQTP